MIRILPLIAFLLFAMPCMPAFGQDSADTQKPPLLMLKQQEPSHPERVLMAFHKVADLEPDFLNWAQRSPFLLEAKADDRDAIISREHNRLRRSYAELDMSEPLVVHVKIHLDNYSTIQEVLHLSEFTPKTFFSFSLYNESIAIVPKGIAQFATMSIGKSEMDQMLNKAGGGQVVAEILLKPVVADARAPFVYNEKYYWLLLAEIGEIRFWNKDPEPELLWMHRADWYKPKENSALMDLKGETGLQ